MKTLKQRTIQMVFDLEWCVNHVDGRGGRCPFCGAIQGEVVPQGKAPHDCGLAKLLRDILASQAAAKRDTSLDE